MKSLKYTTETRYILEGIEFKKASAWEGFENWVDDQGRSVIVSRKTSDNPFAQAFAGLSGDGTSPEVVVIAASPDLHSLLCHPAPITRERAALQQIRSAGYNDHPTAAWMQKVAAHALEPQKFPHPGEQPKSQ